MSQVHVIHENAEWVVPLRAAFAELGTFYEEWFLDQGILDLRQPAPEGVFYNRMSASSHTRDHRFAAEYAGAVLSWLERHGRTVVNGSRALQLEISKVAQYQALAGFGIDTPETIAVIGRHHIREAAASLRFPLVLKHNRGGKGLGVRLFFSLEALDQHLASDEFEAPIDGITLVQSYIQAPEPWITRVEFVGGEFLYAVRVDTSAGFELCPADACSPDGSERSGLTEACPAVAPSERFRIIDGFNSTLIPRYQAFLKANGIGIAGIEFIVDGAGRPWTYDVNTNTNYNPDAERRAGKFGMKAIARHLAGLAETRRDLAA